MSSNLSGTARRTPGVFIALVFALSLPFWVVGAFAGRIPGLPMELPVSALMFVCPIVAAVILLRRQEGPGAARRLLRRTLALGGMRRARWFLVTVLVVPLIEVVAYAVGGTGTGVHVSLLAIPLLFALFFVAAACEEAGWMGYAADSLRQRLGTLGMGLALGLTWAVWHLVPLVQAGRSVDWIAWWFAGTVATRLVIVELYDATGGSVLSAVVVHAVLNLTQSTLPGYASDTRLVACTAVVTAVAWVALRLLPNSRAGSAPRGRSPAPRR